MDEINEKVPQMKADCASVKQRTVANNIVHAVQCVKELDNWQNPEYAVAYLLGFIAGEESGKENY